MHVSNVLLKSFEMEFSFSLFQYKIKEIVKKEKKN